MTSKEALEILLVGYYNNANYQDVIEAREKLEKDLEVLEIIKNVFNYRSVQKFVDNMTKDEFFTVQEWLESDK